MRVGFALILSVMVLATEAEARHRQHRIQPGETIAGLAEYYYGADWKEVYISTHNRLEDGSLGERKTIELPRSYVYTARAGDSFASIAAKRLFRTDRYPVLLRFNSLRSTDELEVGQELLMPFHLFHFVEKGDSLSRISARYYRTRKLASVLRDYNALKSNTLEVGQKVVVPIFDKVSVDLDDKPSPPKPSPAKESMSETARPTNKNAESKPSDNVTAKPAPPSGDEARVPAMKLESVQSAVNAYRNGFFKRACASFERHLEGKLLEPAQRTRVIQYLGFCSVAEGDESAARDYFRSWLLTDPEATLDRRLTSPKILRIFDEVVSEVRPEP